jgi:hypothetical protein
MKPGSSLYSVSELVQVGYSLRNAVSGSTCSARIAGSAQATSEITATTIRLGEAPAVVKK